MWHREQVVHARRNANSEIFYVVDVCWIVNAHLNINSSRELTCWKILYYNLEIPTINSRHNENDNLTNNFYTVPTERLAGCMFVRSSASKCMIMYGDQMAASSSAKFHKTYADWQRMFICKFSSKSWTGLTFHRQGKTFELNTLASSYVQCARVFVGMTDYINRQDVNGCQAGLSVNSRSRCIQVLKLFQRCWNGVILSGSVDVRTCLRRSRNVRLCSADKLLDLEAQISARWQCCFANRFSTKSSTSLIFIF